MIRRPKRHRGRALAFAALMATLLCLAPAAEARVGALDVTFGNSGRLSLPFRSFWASIAVAPDGTLVVNGPRVLRYTNSGQLDSSWGSEGQISLPATIDGLPFYGGSMSIDSQGRLVFFGSVSSPDQFLKEPASLLYTPATWQVVMRFTPDGTLDPTFGRGNGFIRSDFGLRASLDPALPSIHSSGALDSKDRPVLLARLAGVTGGCNYGHTNVTWYPRALVRLTTGGDLDSSFGGGDGVSEIPDGYERASTLGINATDAPVASAGSANCRGNLVYRYSPDGSLASRIDYPNFVLNLLDPGGGAILRREAGLRTAVLAKTKNDGSLDPNWGREGIARVAMPPGEDRWLQPVALDSQGRVILVGHLTRLRHRSKKPKPQERRYLSIGRLTATGRPDLAFGKKGWMLTRLPSQGEIGIERATLDGQGRLLVLVRAEQTHTLRRYLLSD